MSGLLISIVIGIYVAALLASILATVFLLTYEAGKYLLKVVTRRGKPNPKKEIIEAVANAGRRIECMYSERCSVCPPNGNCKDCKFTNAYMKLTHFSWRYRGKKELYKEKVENLLNIVIECAKHGKIPNYLISETADILIHDSRRTVKTDRIIKGLRRAKNREVDITGGVELISEQSVWMMIKNSENTND